MGSATLSRAEAWNLLCEWTSSESLRRHMLAVEAAMRAYALRLHQPVELWGLTGLLHDLDYERYPSPIDGHPRHAVETLSELGYPPELVRAIASHADYLDVPRVTPLERALYAVDELSGFVVACAQVRPAAFSGMTVKSVKKKLSQPSFAAAVDREAISRGATELGVELDEHIGSVVAALSEESGALGFDRREPIER